VLKIVGRWLFRVIVALMAATVVLYAIDWAAYKLTGSRQSTVTVSRTMVVPLNNKDQEYDYLGTSNVPCSISLFPQGGNDPCWYLRRHPTQTQNL
jgi:hypothetical protein